MNKKAAIKIKIEEVVLTITKKKTTEWNWNKEVRKVLVLVTLKKGIKTNLMTKMTLLKVGK
jgi:hypothetical protein